MRHRYMVEGHGDSLGDVWSSDYAGSDAGCPSLREAVRCVTGLRRLRDDGENWSGPWRIVRISDGCVMRQWGRKA